MAILENNYEAVRDYISNLNDSDLLDIYREYCEKAGYLDDEVYYNDENFFEAFFSNKVEDAVRAMQYGDYNYIDSFVKFNGLGNLDSSNYVCDLIDVDELTAYVFDNPEEFEDYIEFEEDEDHLSSMMYGVDNNQ